MNLSNRLRLALLLLILYTGYKLVLTFNTVSLCVVPLKGLFCIIVYEEVQLKRGT